MSYIKALKKLESLPPGERQLAAGQYVWQVKKGKSHCGCAIGKLLTERQRVKLFSYVGDSNKSGVEDLANFLGVSIESDPDGIIDTPIGVADLTYREANALQDANDSFGRTDEEPYKNVNDFKTRKARYKRIIAWLKARVGMQAAAF